MKSTVRPIRTMFALLQFDARGVTDPVSSNVTAAGRATYRYVVVMATPNRAQTK
jgi:hypothetical protein